VIAKRPVKETLVTPSRQKTISISFLALSHRRRLSQNCERRLLVASCLSVCFIATYLLTPWYRVLLEKLTGLQLVKKFPAFHGSRKFITALTTVRHLSLSWASPIQSLSLHTDTTPPQPNHNVTPTHIEPEQYNP